MTDHYILGEYRVDVALDQIVGSDFTERLNPKAMDILIYLVNKAPEVASSDELLAHFWPNRVVDEGTIHRRISQIRQALHDDPRNPAYIETIPKRGYRCIAAIQRLDAGVTEAGVSPASVTPEKRSSLPRPGMAAIFAVVVLGALTLGLALYPRTFKATASDGSAVVAGSATGEVMVAPDVRRQQINNLHTVAVLPFDDFDDTLESAQFLHRIREDTVGHLVQYDLLQVSSRTIPEGKNQLDAVAMAELGAAYVLAGSIGLSDQDKRVSVQLIRVEDGNHVWSKAYDLSVTKTSLFPLDIAANIAFLTASEIEFDIHSRFGGGGYGLLEGVDRRALELFMTSEYEYQRIRSGEGGNWMRVEQFLLASVELAPDFFAAQLSLANLYLHRLNNTLPFAQARSKAQLALKKAGELSPEEPGLQFQTGQFHLYMTWDYAQAQQLLERNLIDVPNCAWCYFFLSAIAQREGRSEEALRLRRAAIGLDLGSENIALWTGVASQFASSGDHTETLDLTGRILPLIAGGIDRALILQVRATSEIALGNIESAVKLVDEAWSIDGNLHPERYVYLYNETGRQGAAVELLQRSRLTTGDPGWIALGYMSLGDFDKSFQFVEAGIQDHNNLLADHLRTSDSFAPLRSDARYQRILGLLRAAETHEYQNVSKAEELSAREPEPSVSQ